MSKKPTYIPRKMDHSEGPHLQKDLNTLFGTRVEAIHFNNSGTLETHSYPLMLSGEEIVSSNGSETVVTSFGFNGVKFEKPFVAFAQANLSGARIIAKVIDLTQTGITIEVGTTQAISQITTSAFRVSYFVVGSAP